MDQAETLGGVVSVIPELDWSDHVGQLRLLVDPAHRSQGSAVSSPGNRVAQILPPALSSQPYRSDTDCQTAAVLGAFMYQDRTGSSLCR